jgi:glycosyltransferase involved in cell wall biosynthesis
MRDLLPDDSYGIVLEEPDVEAMARHVVWAAAHKDELRLRGERCKDLVRREFSWEKTALATLAACIAR